jgi:hypothetical protein
MKNPTHEEVAHSAHQIWQDSGCPEGRDVEHWLEAESCLATSQTATTTATAATEAVVEQRHEARAPIKARKSAPKTKPAETGKPLWSQPHSQ